MQFDDATLLEYIERFYGYGNYRSQHWLVGMEEGGGDNLAEVASRLNAWQKRGKPELDDVLTIGASSPLMKSRTYENGRTQKKSLFAQFPGILATARNCPYS